MGKMMWLLHPTIQDYPETEDLLDHAEQNISGLTVATAAYCKARNLSFADWVTVVGNYFAPTWEELKGQGAIDVAHRVAFNMLTAGAAVEALSGDDKRAEVRCAWPLESKRISISWMCRGTTWTRSLTSLGLLQTISAAATITSAWASTSRWSSRGRLCRRRRRL